MAPLAAVIGLATFLYYALDSVELLLGVTGIWATALAGLVFVIFALGMFYGLFVKFTNPNKYARIKKVLME
ncbi:hypothetical protein D3C72_2525120 [compost metagenome]